MDTYNNINNSLINLPVKFYKEILKTVQNEEKYHFFLNLKRVDIFFLFMCDPNLNSRAPIHGQYLCQILEQSDERFFSYRETTKN